MTAEQHRKMLEAAAKACGFKKWRVLTSDLFQVSNNENWNETFAKWTKWTDWNPLTNPADTAEMSITLMLWVSHDPGCVSVCNGNYAVTAKLKDHDNSRLKAWMYAATMCAAKIGCYTE